MIDDELLQELLSKGSNLYNNGDYRGAISVWREALQTDPSSQRAREGIQMATLLLGDWESPPVEHDAGAAPAADGAPADGAGRSPAEIARTLDDGIAGLKSLLAKRMFPEALEGARALMPIDPESEEVRAILEEAQQAFESAPFIEEHITLARELLGQDRDAEAEAQCQKVFALDAGNPQARALLAEIALRRAAVQPAGAESAGHTVKLRLEDLLGGAAGKKGAEGIAGPGTVAPPGDGPGPVPMIEPMEGLETSLTIGSLEGPGDVIPMGPDAAAPGGPPSDGNPEEVEAVTVVPPSVRAVSRSPEPPTAPGPGRPLTPPAAPPAATPSGARWDEASLKPAGGVDTAAWEIELTQLNLKKGERDILGPSAAAARPPAAYAAPDQAEADLMALLDNDLPAGPGAHESAAGDAIPLAGLIPAPAPASQPAPAPGVPDRAAREARGATDPARSASERQPQIGRRAMAAAAGEDPGIDSPRSPIPRYFALVGIVILAAAAAGWWYFFQPRGSGAPEAPGQAASPAGAPSGPPEAADGGPIPTPIGGSDRHPAPGPESPGENTGTGGAPAANTPGAPMAHAQAAAAAGAPAAGTTSPPLSREETERGVARRLENGRRLVAAGRWNEALDELRGAASLDPGNMEVRDLADKSQAEIERRARQVNEFEEVRRLFDDKDYQNTLWKLYRLPREPVYGDVDLYIRNAWYNWAVVAMRAGDATDALQKLSEVASIDPDDADAEKIRQVAERYTARAKDRTFFAFAAGLTLRRMDQK